MAKGKYSLHVDWNNDDDFGDTGEAINRNRSRRMTWTRGRHYASQLLGRSIAGKLTAVLDNRSGDYSSFNSSSPIAGNIVPGRKVQVQAGTGDFPYEFPIIFNTEVNWTGFLQTLTPFPDMHGNDTAVLEAWGPLGYVNEDDVEIAMQTSINTKDAMDDVFDAAGWPAGDRDFNTGQTTITRFWADRMKTLAAARLVEETEGGFLWEKKDGKIGFLDRHARLKSPYTTSQATFSDASGAARSYSRINQQDPFSQIFPRFTARVETYTVGSLAILWTHPETGASSPALAPGESKVFWARYPTPDAGTDAIAVDAWTTPVATTDYTANSQSGGGGTDLTSDIGVAVSKFGEAMKITYTNNGTVLAYMTLMQARGTPVNRNDPIHVESEDATAVTAYGERTFEAKSKFLPDSGEAQDWCDFHVGIYKDPIPILAIRIHARRDHNHLVEALTRDINDRVTIVGNNDAGLGINEDFFIEAEKHVVDAEENHTVTWKLSPATGYSDFWILDTSALDTATRLAY